MYKIFADNTLIYDSTLDDYKIGKGSISLEVNKSGSFTFSIYPDHFYYDRFVRLKTVITVYKFGKIVFRGRILNDVTDYFNNKNITCEGELGFLQDSIIRPYDFSGTPEELLRQLITEHNDQVDDFKQFKIGTVTVVDSNNYIARSNSGYESALSNLNSRLIEDSLGGYFFITHDEDGTDPIPTLNYLADFTNVSSQVIEFGSNLKNYTKTVKADSIATAIIPLGHEVDDGDDTTENKKLTIAEVNNGKDYVFDPSAVALYGWIFRVETWDDVTDPLNLKRKAEEHLASIIQQNITIELTAIDLRLIDPNVESFNLGDYIRVTSAPHNFDSVLLCNKQTIDLLKPENDTLTLGSTYSKFTESVSRLNGVSETIAKTKSDVLKTISSRELATQRLIDLMNLSLGVYKTEEQSENGSIIHYLHDQPSLTDSQTIWKMASGGFAVSTDGGNTWSSGLDASGNAVLNILSVIGVKAEWIDADDLSSISANIGGWNIDETGIYKTVADSSNSNNVYKIYFKPPTQNQAAKSEVLTCKKSTNGGGTFTTQFVLYSDGSAQFGNFTLSSSGGIVFNSDNGRTITLDKWGFNIKNSSGETMGSMLLVGNESVISVNKLSVDAINGYKGATDTITLKGADNASYRLNISSGRITTITKS